VVKTQSGPVRGLLLSFSSHSLNPVYAYLGIQYASLNGPDLRFMPATTPAEKWTDVRIANQFRPVCPHNSDDSVDDFLLRYPMPKSEYDVVKRVREYSKEQTEECLNLNVYVPVKG
ncbi:hypothetical protein HELRODRAFT_127551, partial [Helobdella robusta]|uniref:Carboxylesterase type B domain-containing protein n=1 Tax=Helobdella robusta TaxID=6412 RepID=T1EHF2_HELRO